MPEGCLISFRVLVAFHINKLPVNIDLSMYLIIMRVFEQFIYRIRRNRMGKNDLAF